MKKRKWIALLLVLMLVAPYRTVVQAATTISRQYFYYGDLDGNSRVTTTDLSVLNQAVNGQISLSSIQKKCADLNGDGRVDSSDVDLMRQYLIGSIYRFPVGYGFVDYVVQDNYTLEINKTEITMDGEAGQSSFYVDTKGDGGFRASSNSAWLKVGRYSYNTASSASFTGSSTVYIYADANIGGASRSGVITLVHNKDSSVTKTVHVTQKSSPLKASLEIIKSQTSFTEKGGSSTFYVNTNGSGGFRVNSSSAWLKVGRGSGMGSSAYFSGSGTVYVTVEANNSISYRSGTITVMHDKVSSLTKTIYVTQQGGTLTASLEPDKTQMNFSKDGGLGSFYVNTNGSGGFRASSGSSWLKVGRYSYNAGSSASFTGNGTVYVIADANIGDASRSGTITLVHNNDSSVKRTIRVTQEADNVKVSLEPDKSQIRVSADGGSDSFSVNTDGSGGFRVNSRDTWLKVGKNSYSTNSSSLVFEDSGTVYVSVEENSGTSSRSGTITLIHDKDSSVTRTIRVTQEEKAVKASLKVDKTQINISRDGGSDSFSVNTDGTGGFYASSGSSWLKVGRYSFSVDSSATFTGNSTVYVSVEANDSTSSRNGTITLTHSEDSSVTSVIRVEQEAGEQPVLKTNQAEIQAEADGMDSSIYVDTEGTGGFRASSDSSWIKVASSYGDNGRNASFANSGTVYIAISKNSENSSRSGTITLTHEKDSSVSKTIQVTQQGKESYLKADVSKITANARGLLSKSTVNVDTQGTGGFQVSCEESWMKVGKSDNQASASRSLTFTNSGQFYVFVENSEETSARQGKITVTHGDGKLKTEITVVQNALNAKLTVGTDGLTADRAGVFSNNAVSVSTQQTGGFSVEVESCDWLAVASSNVENTSLGLSSLSYDGDGKFYVVADRNTGKKRTAKITVRHAIAGVSKEITVTQLGNEGSYLEVDRETAYFDEPDAATSGIAHVYADSGTTWRVVSSEDWIKIKPDSLFSKEGLAISGSGDGAFYICVDKNTSFRQRMGTVTIEAPGTELESHTIIVSQAENEIEPHPILEELEVSVSHKTFNVGKTSKIRFDFPEGLYMSDLAKITYSSNKTKVAVVRKNGTIKAKRKGKATITVIAQLEDGYSKTFKLKVTVGKRKVSVTKKK